MRKFRKSICAILVCLALLALMPLQAFAQGPIDLEQDVDLTIHYVDEGTPIVNAQFDLYLVADVDRYARMTLTDEFDDYPISIDGLNQEGWDALAATLKGYVQRDHVTPVDTDWTDETGTASFPTEGTELKPGLYLVVGYRATTDDFNTYVATPFMVFLPGQNNEDNSWEYSQTAVPKFDKDINPPDEPGDKVITRKAIKIWDDEGFETIRPESVTVRLLCDGEEYDVQELNAENNWRYSWDNLDPDHEWLVVEDEMEHYETSTTMTGIIFTVTNKYVVPLTPDRLPLSKQVTGDTPEKPGNFIFVLEAVTENAPMPEGAEENKIEYAIEGAGTVEVGEITFEFPGTYVYKAYERDTKLENYTYDTSVYTITYEVTQEDGVLSVEVTAVDVLGNEVDAIAFNNVYKKPTPIIPQTGQLWWPVPVLLCLGVICLIVGVIRRKSKVKAK